MLGLIAKKLGMTQLYVEGKAIPVTVLEAQEGVITDIKTKEKDGYNAIQVGFIDTKEKRVTKPLLGVYKKVGVSPKKILKEFRVDDVDSFEVKGEVKVDIFQKGEIVDVIGHTKGRGFSGVMKRHNFAGGPDGHGSMFNRRVGSIGNCEFPGRVVKGRKMPGHYGNERVTIKNLEVVFVDPEKKLIAIKGAVPGSKGSYVNIIKKGN
ncbi:50S ribosomal protein L3 [Hippea maritima]|uniref:Large ribosomal subunit protein uL3 n=1 Tax=Hippea maritima (strain ATCC 700847 / DSM 10411 / MH2) TaxID=760142 RepID=F2LXU2_HIPMA|nr:50S ribosomal protein L3 [Hippea maritima]AEA34333.1 50S ribosomal protein L3 [Hippea maritima DSM 10411]